MTAFFKPNELGLLLLVWAAVGGGIGAAIGSGKGRAGAGFWLGFLLGFVGWIIVAVMEPSFDVRAGRNAELARAIMPGAPRRARGGLIREGGTSFGTGMATGGLITCPTAGSSRSTC